jgi:hypothetical protein
MSGLDYTGFKSASQSGTGTVVPAISGAIFARSPVDDIFGSGERGIRE